MGSLLSWQLMMVPRTGYCWFNHQFVDDSGALVWEMEWTGLLEPKDRGGHWSWGSEEVTQSPDPELIVA